MDDGWMDGFLLLMFLLGYSLKSCSENLCHGRQYGRSSLVLKLKPMDKNLHSSVTRRDLVIWLLKNEELLF